MRLGLNDLMINTELSTAVFATMQVYDTAEWFTGRLYSVLDGIENVRN
jgi:hypothetical protein